MATDVFLSCESDTRPLAQQLSRALQTHGIQTWADFKDLKPGDQWREQIEEALDKADAIVILIGPESRATPRWEAERGAALVKVWSDSRKRLIPVVVGTAEPPPFLCNWSWLAVDPAAEPAGWTRHVVDALVAGHSDAQHELAPERRLQIRREQEERLNEIDRAVKEFENTAAASNQSDNLPK